MKVKSYLVVDDNEADALQLKEHLDKFPFFTLAGIVPSVEAACEFLIAQSVDLLFLDINLGEQSGLTLLKSGITLPPVIITSAYPNFAIDSYEIGKASDYLLKPFTHERLHMALTRALQFQAQDNSIIDVDGVFLKMGRKIKRFPFESIAYTEAFGAYSKIYADDQMHLVNERLSSLVSLLPARLFMRVHKSYIININKVTSYDRHNLWLGQAKIPIGISFRPRLEGILGLFEGND